MPEQVFPDASPSAIAKAMEDAWFCFGDFRGKPGLERAAFLRSIARNLEKDADELLALADLETSLGPDRLGFELTRTVAELRSFAALADSGKWEEPRVEKAEPDRTPLPKPGMRTVNLPVGPVVVIGACNFPFAISVVGTDTASAMAVGCPVIVKAHPDHAGTCEALAEKVRSALERTGMPAKAFQLLHGVDHAVTRGLVEHPRTACVAFTGSLKGGHALMKIANGRPKPIPFHAEMGSLNPVFILPHALERKGEELAEGYVAAVNLYAGQMCTKPGLLALIDGPGLNSFLESIRQAIRSAAPLDMLNRTVFENFNAVTRDLLSSLELVASNENAPGQRSRPALCRIFQVKGREFMKNQDLRSEAFGPASIIVRCSDQEELMQLARSMEGSLTATIHAHTDDAPLAQALFPLIESRVGRFLWGGFPPGVIPSIATHHGGPWPATTDPRHTSIGLYGYRRFVRPVCRQGFPDD